MAAETAEPIRSTADRHAGTNEAAQRGIGEIQSHPEPG